MIRSLQGDERIVVPAESPVTAEIASSSDENVTGEVYFNFYLDRRRAQQLAASTLTIQFLRSSPSATDIFGNLSSKNDVLPAIQTYQQESLENFLNFQATNVIETFETDMTEYLSGDDEVEIEALVTKKFLGKQRAGPVGRFEPTFNIVQPELQDFFTNVRLNNIITPRVDDVQSLSLSEESAASSTFVEDVRLYSFPIQQICRRYRDTTFSAIGEIASADEQRFLKPSDFKVRSVKKQAKLTYSKDGVQKTEVSPAQAAVGEQVADVDTIEAAPDSSARAYLGSIYQSSITNSPLFVRSIRPRRRAISVPVQINIQKFESLYAKVTIKNSRGVILQRNTFLVHFGKVVSDATRPRLQPLLAASLSDVARDEGETPDAYPPAVCNVTRRDPFNSKTIIMIKRPGSVFERFMTIESEVGETREIHIPVTQGSGVLRIRAISVQGELETSSKFSEVSVPLNGDGVLNPKQTTQAIACRARYNGPDSDGLYNVQIRTRVPGRFESAYSSLSIRRLSLTDDESDPSAGIVVGVTTPGGFVTDEGVSSGDVTYAIDGYTDEGDLVYGIEVCPVKIPDFAVSDDSGQSGTDGTVLRVATYAEKRGDPSSTTYVVTIEQDEKQQEKIAVEDRFDVVIDPTSVKFQMFDPFGEPIGVLPISRADSVDVTSQDDGTVKIEGTFKDEVIQEESTKQSKDAGNDSMRKRFNATFSYRRKRRQGEVKNGG
jgi:hypothetical protein